MVRQSQDVSADGIQKKSASLVLARKKEAFQLHRICAYVLISTGVVGVGCFKSQDGEYGNGGVEGCGTVYYTYHNSILLAVVSNRQRLKTVL